MIEHHGDLDGIVDRLIMFEELTLIRAHVPRCYNHNAVGAVVLCRLAHFDHVSGTICACRGDRLYAAVVRRGNVCAVYLHLLLGRERYHLSGRAGGNNAGHAVFREESGNLLDAGEVDAFVFVKRGYDRNINAAEFLPCHAYTLLFF